MTWYSWLLIACFALLLVYFGIGFGVAFALLHKKPRSEEQTYKRELSFHIPEELLHYPYTEAWLNGSQGKMFARVYTIKNCDRWVLVFHGYNSNGLAVMKYGKMFNDLGYNVLSPDFCHAPRSEGSYFSFGYYEAQDIERWMRYVQNTYHPSQIGLFGVSMGASASVIAASKNKVDFLIAYCPYYSYRRIVTEKASTYRLPCSSLFWPSLALGSYLAAGGMRAKELNISEYLKKVTCPTILLHSKKDDFTSYLHSVDLHAAQPNTQLHLFEEGVHAKAYAANPTEYTRVVREFLQSVNSGNSAQTISSLGVQ